MSLESTRRPTERGMEQRTLEATGSLALEATGPLAAHSKRAAHCASLTVILLSAGERSTLERALSTISGRCERLEAQTIVVRMNLVDDFVVLHEAFPDVMFIDAPDGSTSVEMREMGMAHADGDIVSLRDDVAVADGLWLSAFDAMVGVIDDPTRMDTEVLITPVSDDSIASFEQARRQGWGRFAPHRTLIRNDARGDASIALSPLLPVADSPASSQREI